MTRHDKLVFIGKCLNRYENSLTQFSPELTDFRKNRFDRLIDLDVCGVDVKALFESDDETFSHDVNGIFANLVRNSDDPSKSELRTFVPRVGFDRNETI